MVTIPIWVVYGIVLPTLLGIPNLWKAPYFQTKSPILDSWAETRLFQLRRQRGSFGGLDLFEERVTSQRMLRWE
jgi:hypothetical protein